MKCALTICLIRILGTLLQASKVLALLPTMLAGCWPGLAPLNFYYEIIKRKRNKTKKDKENLEYEISEMTYF